MEEIISLMQPFYSSEDIKKIIEKLTEYIKELPRYTKDLEDTDWYKSSNIYFIYPDAIQTEENFPLENIKFFLPHIKELGCDAVHLLPFFQSPMRDKGFDISNYYLVRENLGGMEKLMEVKEKAESLGMHIFIDLVLNHVSKDHEWFKKAENGEEFYRDFFIYTKETPQYVGEVIKKSRIYAEYLVEGEKKLVSIAFPELSGAIPHWVQGKDWYWYYHTYYPHQLDVNWKNVNVFIEFAKILLFWSSRGFNFRFDAVPFVGKGAYKILDEHDPFTHAIVAAFKSLSQLVYPNSTFILEVNEHITSDIRYFGTTKTKQAELLYNFQLCALLWVSLIEEDASYIWGKLKQEEKIPRHAQWINFLRNHDEISFAGIKKELLEKIHKKLFPLGLPFRKGYGLSGRTLSLLQKNENKLFMSYFLLASLPGCLLFPYGDEFGKENIPAENLPLEDQQDTRNINRGTLDANLMFSIKGKRINSEIAKILRVRQTYKKYFHSLFEEISVDKTIFAAKYKSEDTEICIFINLSNKKQQITYDCSSYKEIAHINSVICSNTQINLKAYSGIWLKKHIE